MIQNITQSIPPFKCFVPHYQHLGPRDDML